MSVAWESASAACFPGPGVGCDWLTSVTHVFSSQEPEPRRSSSCPLLSALCPLQDPGQQGKSRPPCPPCPTGRCFVPGPPRQCKRSPRLCSPGQMHTLSVPSFPPALSSQANVVVQGAQTLTFLNQPDREARAFTEEETVHPKCGQLFQSPYDTQGGEAGVLATLRGRNRDPHPSTSPPGQQGGT